jgi:DnaJ-class molecular chaperone
LGRILGALALLPSGSFLFVMSEFLDSFSRGGNSFSASSSRGGGGPRKDAPIMRDLMLSLDELYVGCTKKMKIERMVQSSSGQKTETKILQVDVKAGFKEGTKITFEDSGDEKPGFD